MRGMTFAVSDLACLAEKGQIKSRYLKYQSGIFEAKLPRNTHTSRTCEPVPSLRNDSDLGTAISSGALVESVSECKLMRDDTAR